LIVVFEHLKKVALTSKALKRQKEEYYTPIQNMETREGIEVRGANQTTTRNHHRGLRRGKRNVFGKWKHFLKSGEERQE
jgi:hypothetical protein